MTDILCESIEGKQILDNTGLLARTPEGQIIELECPEEDRQACSISTRTELIYCKMFAVDHMILDGGASLKLCSKHSKEFAKYWRVRGHDIEIIKL